MLSYTILAALLARERLGIGQEVHISHLGSMMALQGLSVATVQAVGGEVPFRSREEAGNPLWNHYLCKDGKWICLGIGVAAVLISGWARYDRPSSRRDAHSIRSPRGWRRSIRDSRLRRRAGSSPGGLARRVIQLRL